MSTVFDEIKKSMDEQRAANAKLTPEEFRAQAKKHSGYLTWAWIGTGFLILGVRGWGRWTYYMLGSTLGFFGGILGTLGSSKNTWRDQPKEP